MTFKTATVIKSACMALTLSFATTAIYSATATSAYAERGGNGNGNGNSGNRGGNKPSKTESGSSNGNGNGRGAIARELGGLNAAHANANALANASPNSMPGKLNTYKLAQEDFADVVAIQDEAYSTLNQLEGLSDAEIAEMYPDDESNGTYDAAVIDARQKYSDTRDDAVAAQTTANDSLAILTGGKELSDEAMAELWNLLGL